jgi:hypothetical protein
VFKLKSFDQVHRHRVIFQSPDASKVYEEGYAECPPTDLKTGEIVEGFGDNLYELLPSGGFPTLGGAIAGPTHLRVKPHVPDSETGELRKT